MIKTYERLTAPYATVNLINVVHIALERQLTPDEVLELWEGLSADAPYWVRRAERHGQDAFAIRRQAADGWVTRLKSFHDMSGKVAAEPFRRTELSKAVVHYTDEGPRGDKALLICFAGGGQVPMMPVASFLQALDARTVDVAVLRDFTRSAFRQGAEGLADSLPEVWEKLPQLLDFADYRRVCALGVSGGGVPALMTAVRLGLPAVVSVGGNHPADRRWVRLDGLSGVEVIESLTKQATVLPRATLMHGFHAPRDKEAADAMAAIIPAEVIAVEDGPLQVGHNALYPLLRQGRLSQVLADRLGL